MLRAFNRENENIISVRSNAGDGIKKKPSQTRKNRAGLKQKIEYNITW